MTKAFDKPEPKKTLGHSRYPVPDIRHKIRIGKNAQPRPFPFKTKIVDIVVVLSNENDRWYLKQVEAVTLGDFGYHNDFSTWNVFALSNGGCIARYETEKDARVVIKRLYCKIKDLDLKKRDDLTLWFAQVLHWIQNTPRIGSETPAESPETYEKDVPF